MSTSARLLSYLQESSLCLLPIQFYPQLWMYISKAVNYLIDVNPLTWGEKKYISRVVLLNLRRCVGQSKQATIVSLEEMKLIRGLLLRTWAICLGNTQFFWTIWEQRNGHLYQVSIA